MSSITRVMLGLPQLPTTKVNSKVFGNKIFTRATMANGDIECSIIEKTDSGMKLLKSSVMNSRGCFISKLGKPDIFIDKKSGRVFDYKA